ncbi:MAG TPA: efflux RND transporter permease subunit [Bacteroidia bacterium]|jgi:multidrug efflux pump|nr:efflux RND transporter permease subunit [Bacteroidia bacterium]
MSLSSVSLKRPVFASVMSIIIVLFGCIGFKRLGVRDYPAIDPPVINVVTNYTGADPNVIESQITTPLEKAINGVQGIKDITSFSAQGVSSISVEFNLGYDMETAANDVRDKVSQALAQLPQNLDAPPVVTKLDANSDAIVALLVKSKTKNALQVTDYCENVLMNTLQTIPDVSTIQVWGEKKYAMRIWMDPAKLAAFKMTPLDVQNALIAKNVYLPSGSVEGTTTQLTVNTRGNLITEQDFDNMVIRSGGEKTIRIKDIGYAELGAQNPETIMKESGTPMIGLGIVPQPGANYVSISDEFYKRMAMLKATIPKDYELDVALDTTKYIKNSIADVEETLAIAFALVILIIFLFFRDLLIAFRPLIDIPVCIIGSFFIMYVAGLSLNILTMLAIVLATGLVVDDGIVVTENIYKKIEEGMSPMEAALKGCNEIFMVVITTSITLAIVFLPIIFLSGFTGKLFREFAIVVAGSVLISAFVSLSLTPVLSVKLARKGNKKSKFYEQSEPFFIGMNNTYAKMLKAFMRQRWVAIPIIVACLGIIFIMGGSLHSELAPLEDKSLLRFQILGPEGASYDYTSAYMDSLNRFVEDSVPEKKVFLTIAAPSFAGSGALNTGYARMVLPPPDERKRSQNEIANYMTARLAKFPSARTFAVQEQTIAVGSGRLALPIQFVIEATTVGELRKVLPRFLALAQKDSLLTKVDANLKFNHPQLDISIDREKADALNVPIMSIAQTLEASMSGQRFQYFYLNNNQYQVIGEFLNQNRTKPLDIQSIYLRSDSGTGNLVELDNLVRIRDTANPAQLFHYNRFESATIAADIAPGHTIGDAINELNRLAKLIDTTTKKPYLPDNIRTELAGASRDFMESSSDLLFAFVLALVLIYLVLAAQFESFIDPFIIMITVPMAIAGAILCLWYFNQTLNIFSEIGIITLIGLVTKNSILIVEFANQLQEQGVAFRDSIMQAAEARLRPILMTTLAMALGALPIALALGAGATSRKSLGTVIVGGLLFALILTLFVIPAVYSFLGRPVKHIEKTSE